MAIIAATVDVGIKQDLENDPPFPIAPQPTLPPITSPTQSPPRCCPASPPHVTLPRFASAPVNVQAQT